MMVSPIVLAMVAPISGYLSDKTGSEILTLIGLALTGTGLLLIYIKHWLKISKYNFQKTLLTKQVEEKRFNKI